MNFLFPLCYLFFGRNFFPFSSKPCPFFLTCNLKEMSPPSSGDLLLAAAVAAAFDPASGNHEGGSVARSPGLSTSGCEFCCLSSSVSL